MPGKRAAKKPVSTQLKGWTAIARYLAIPVSTAHRWARDGMPVRREGRFTVANQDELRAWLGRESHMSAPAQILSDEADVAAALGRLGGNAGKCRVACEPDQKGPTGQP